MKKNWLLIGIGFALIGLSAWALWEILNTEKNYGTDTKTSSTPVGNQAQETSKEGSQETGTGVNQKKD